MKKYILALLSCLALFSCSPAFAGPVPGAPVVPSITVGGRTDTDLTNTIVLICLSVGTATNSTPRRVGTSTSGYTPSGSKNFYLKSLTLFNVSATAVTPAIGYQDTDIGIDTATSPTNGVYMNGSSSLFWGATPATVGSTSSISFPNGVEMIPNGKYGYCNSNNTAATDEVLLYGYEQ